MDASVINSIELDTPFKYAFNIFLHFALEFLELYISIYGKGIHYSISDPSKNQLKI